MEGEPAGHTTSTSASPSAQSPAVTHLRDLLHLPAQHRIRETSLLTHLDSTMASSWPSITEILPLHTTYHSSGAACLHSGSECCESALSHMFDSNHINKFRLSPSLATVAQKGQFTAYSDADANRQKQTRRDYLSQSDKASAAFIK